MRLLNINYFSWYINISNIQIPMQYTLYTYYIVVYTIHYTVYNVLYMVWIILVAKDRFFYVLKYGCKFFFFFFIIYKFVFLDFYIFYVTRIKKHQQSLKKSFKIRKWNLLFKKFTIFFYFFFGKYASTYHKNLSVQYVQYI